MPVRMTMASANAAIQILASAMKVLNAAREHSQASKDTDLKSDINTLYDELLALKEAVIRVTDENAELRRTITQQAEKPPEPELKQVGNAIYYFVGDKGPYCQPCYDCNHRLVWLTPPTEYAGGRGRKCEVCNKVFFESAGSPARLQFGGHGNPEDWMR